MEKAEYVDRVAIREKVCTGCPMLVDGVCCDADTCENLIAGFLEEPPADVVPAHRKENAHSVPLTLDELREAAQTGDPVWLVINRIGGWVVIEKVCYESKYPYVDYAEFGSDEPFYFEISKYGDTFMAYRKKPEEDDHA